MKNKLPLMVALFGFYSIHVQANTTLTGSSKIGVLECVDSAINRHLMNQLADYSIVTTAIAKVYYGDGEDRNLNASLLNQQDDQTLLNPTLGIINYFFTVTSNGNPIFYGTTDLLEIHRDYDIKSGALIKTECALKETVIQHVQNDVIVFKQWGV